MDKNTEAVNPDVRDANPINSLEFLVKASEGSDKPNPVSPKTEKEPEVTTTKEEPKATLEDKPKGEVKPEEDNQRKSNLAWIKNRQEKAALKKRIAELENAVKAKGAEQVANPASSENDIEAKVRAKLELEAKEKAYKESIESKTQKAYEDLATDTEVTSMPMGVMDVLDIVEKDPRISRINEIDPELAISEAKKMWKGKLGISKPNVPVSHTPKSRIGGKTDLDAILDELGNTAPGTKRYDELYKAYKKAKK